MTRNTLLQDGQTDFQDVDVPNRSSSLKSEHPNIYQALQSLNSDKEKVEYIRSITIYDPTRFNHTLSRESFSELVYILDEKVKYYEIKGTRNTTL